MTLASAETALNNCLFRSTGLKNTLDPPSRSTLISFGLGLAIVALAGWYLLAWKNLPLYPDEIALRVQSARALVDGFVAYPVFPQCSASPTPIPWPLVPAALIISSWDMTFGWSFVRLVPCVIALLAIITTSVHVQARGPRVAIGLLPIAFLGVAGSGLTMIRMECFQILQAIACLVAYMATKSRRPRGIESPALIFLLIASLLSIFVHPQGLILIPIAVLLAGAIGVRSGYLIGKLTSILVVALLVAGTLGVVGRIEQPCDGAAAITRAMQVKTILGQDQAGPFLQGIAPWINKLDAYARNFTYNAVYPANHLPGLSEADLSRRSVKGANFAIYWISIANILLAICATSIAGVWVTRSLLSSETKLASRFLANLSYGNIYIFIAGISHILYLIYDVEGAFYRIYYFNMIFTILNVIVLANIRGKKQLLLVPAVIGVVGLMFISTRFNTTFFETEFAHGWTGPSLPVNGDWVATSQTVNKLADSCGIPQDGSDLIVDDLTFSALRHHRHLIPITYVMLGDYLTGNPTDGQSFISRLGKLGTAAIAQCPNFTAGVPTDAIRSGGFCCVKFQVK